MVTWFKNQGYLIKDPWTFNNGWPDRFGGPMRSKDIKESVARERESEQERVHLNCGTSDTSEGTV